MCTIWTFKSQLISSQKELPGWRDSWQKRESELQKQKAHKITLRHCGPVPKKSTAKTAFEYKSLLPPLPSAGARDVVEVAAPNQQKKYEFHFCSLFFQPKLLCMVGDKNQLTGNTLAMLMWRNICCLDSESADKKFIRRKFGSLSYHILFSLKKTLKGHNVS